MTHICSRCRGCLVEEGSLLRPVAGALVHELPDAVPLCEDCAALFCDWLRSGNPEHQGEPERAADVRPVRLAAAGRR